MLINQEKTIISSVMYVINNKNVYIQAKMQK